MLRTAVALLLLVSLSTAFAATTVVVNGAPTPLTVVDVAGKAFVDVAALMQLLGGKATYDAAAGKLYVSSTGGAASASGNASHPANSANWGTAQLPGGDGQLGQVYNLRKGSPLYFRLNSAEFTVAQVRFGDTTYIPEANEKLLVLHFSVQNPQKDEVTVRFDSLKFTVVDAMNVNHEGGGDWGDEQTHGTLNMSLKPAQRIEAYTVVTVPAKGVIPKLMVESQNADDGPILRYDLKGQVTALQPPVADPADPTGATALETVPAQFGANYSLGKFDVTVEKTEYVTTALDGDAPADGDRYFVVTLLTHNKAADEQTLRFDTFSATLTDADGQNLQYGNLIAATGNHAFDQGVKADAQTRVRIYFTVPKDAKTKTLSLKEQDSRTYEFDVSK